MPSLRRAVPAVLLSASLLALAGCATTVPGSGGTTPDTDAAADATRVVTTDQGDVTIPDEPERIIVLNSNLAGYLFALDVPVLATLPEAVGEVDPDYPEFWAEEATEAETVILPWSEDGFDFEAMLELDPDLIIAGGQGFSAFQAVEAYDRLTEVAPTVIVSSSLLTWQEQLDFIADDILDDAEGGAELLAAYDARVAEVADAITLPDTPVAYLVTTVDTPYSLPENSALPQALAELGFEPAPVIADNPGFETYGTGDSFELSTEQLSQVFTAPSMFVFPFYEGEGPEIEDLVADPLYASLPAFENGQVYALPSWVYRADYLKSMAMLNYIEEHFS